MINYLCIYYIHPWTSVITSCTACPPGQCAITVNSIVKCAGKYYVIYAILFTVTAIPDPCLVCNRSLFTKVLEYVLL